MKVKKRLKKLFNMKSMRKDLTSMKRSMRQGMTGKKSRGF